MGMREELAKRIERKRAEIAELELQAKQALSYIQALEDTLKMLPRDGANTGEATQILRPNSAVAKAYEVLKLAGTPLHLTDLLRAINKEPSRANQGALNSSLSTYVRKGEIFTRTAPNTYGLREFVATEAASAPPAGFGKDEVEGS